MAFDVNRFRAVMALEGGFSRPNHYEAIITPPGAVNKSGGLSLFKDPGNFFSDLSAGSLGSSLFMGSRSLTYRCETAEIPGRSIATMERRNYGEMDKFGYSTFYAETNLVFYEDVTMGARKFFENWIKLIYNTETNNVYYYDDYIGTIEIRQFDAFGLERFRAKMIEAFPISIGPMPLSWSDTDTLQKVSVTFVYRKYEIK